MGRKPDISNLKLYGSKVFVRVPENKRKSKWDRKADLGILLGYENVGYRVLIDNKIIIARHVDIVEEDVKLVGFKGDNNDNNNNSSENQNDESYKNDMNDKNESSLDEHKKKEKKLNYKNYEGQVELKRYQQGMETKVKFIVSM